MKREKEFPTWGIPFINLSVMLIIFLAGVYVGGKDCITEESTCPCIHRDCICYSAIMDKINEDCGGTHIAKRWGSNEWSVYVKQCKGDYCKYDYVKLEDCLE